MVSKPVCRLSLLFAGALSVATRADAQQCVALLVDVTPRARPSASAAATIERNVAHEPVPDSPANPNDSAAALRIRSELALLGYTLVLAQQTLSLEADSLRDAIARSRCPAVVSLSDVHSLPRARVLVGDSASGRERAATFGPEPSLSADVLGLRVAEFVEASLLELEIAPAPRDDRPSVSPPPTPRLESSAPNRHDAFPSSAPGATPQGLYAGVGGGMLLDGGSLPLAAVLQVHAGVALSDLFGMQLRGLWSLDTQIESGAHRARVSHQLALLSLRARLFGPVSERWELSAEAGLGAHRLRAAGDTAVEVRGRADDVIVPALAAGTRARWFAWRNVAVHAAALAWLDLRRPVIAFPDGSSRASRAPLLSPELGLEVSF